MSSAAERFVDARFVERVEQWDAACNGHFNTYTEQPAIDVRTLQHCGTPDCADAESDEEAESVRARCELDQEPAIATVTHPDGTAVPLAPEFCPPAEDWHLSPPPPPPPARNDRRQGSIDKSVTIRLSGVMRARTSEEEAPEDAGPRVLRLSSESDVDAAQEPALWLPAPAVTSAAAAAKEAQQAQRLRMKEMMAERARARQARQNLTAMDHMRDSTHPPPALADTVLPVEPKGRFGTPSGTSTPDAAGDCGECVNCRDKPNFDSPGTKRKGCLARRETKTLRPSPQMSGDEDGARASWSPAVELDSSTPGSASSSSRSTPPLPPPETSEMTIQMKFTDDSDEEDSRPLSERVSLRRDAGAPTAATPSNADVVSGAAGGAASGADTFGQAVSSASLHRKRRFSLSMLGEEQPVPAPASSRCLVLTNLITPEGAADAREAHMTRMETGNECSKWGEVLRVHVPCSAGTDPAGPPVGGLGRVFVEFGSVEAAKECARAMDGRFFDGRRLGATYYSVEDFLAERLDEPLQQNATMLVAQADEQLLAADAGAQRAEHNDDQRDEASVQVDAEAFMQRFLAFRQHVEMLQEFLSTKAARAKPWNLTVRREAICEDVLKHFSLKSFGKVHLLRATRVAFVDVHGAGEKEDGDDSGGLTVEMYSSFFREVLSSGLFEGAEDGGSLGLLPKPNAPVASLWAIGRLLCKCVLHDQPIGSGLGWFVFEFLADAHEWRVLRTPHAALDALADFDPELSQRWARLLAEPVQGLTLDLFDPTASGGAQELPATAEALGRAVLAGCRHRLLTVRETSLQAIRRGFTEHVDLRIQLGALSSAELRLMLRGNTRLSAAALLGCFQMPDQSAAASEAAGFAAVGSEVPRFLRETIEDETPETGLSEAERMDVLEWATALTALPCGGLKEPITLRFWGAADAGDLPLVHTCSHEVHLPAYPSRGVLRAKLLQAVAHRHDGFNIE